MILKGNLHLQRFLTCHLKAMNTVATIFIAPVHLEKKWNDFANSLDYHSPQICVYSTSADLCHSMVADYKQTLLVWFCSPFSLYPTSFMLAYFQWRVYAIGLLSCWELYSRLLLWEDLTQLIVLYLSKSCGGALESGLALFLWPYKVTVLARDDVRLFTWQVDWIHAGGIKGTL